MRALSLAFSLVFALLLLVGQGTAQNYFEVVQSAAVDRNLGAGFLTGPGTPSVTLTTSSWFVKQSADPLTPATLIRYDLPNQLFAKGSLSSDTIALIMPANTVGERLQILKADFVAYNPLTDQAVVGSSRDSVILKVNVSQGIIDGGIRLSPTTTVVAINKPMWIDTAANTVYVLGESGYVAIAMNVNWPLDTSRGIGIQQFAFSPADGNFANIDRGCFDQEGNVFVIVNQPPGTTANARLYKMALVGGILADVNGATMASTSYDACLFDTFVSAETIYAWSNLRVSPTQVQSSLTRAVYLGPQTSLTLTVLTLDSSQTSGDVPQNLSPYGALDAVGGRLFLTTLSEPAFVLRINLLTLTLDSVLPTAGFTDLGQILVAPALLSGVVASNPIGLGSSIVEIGVNWACPTNDINTPTVVCSGKGICERTLCQCTNSSGDGCQFQACLTNCPNGACVDGECVCDSTHYPQPACNLLRCPNDCGLIRSGPPNYELPAPSPKDPGRCNTLLNPPQCECLNGHSGFDCGISPVRLPCKSRKSCDDCTTKGNIDCGWCGDNGGHCLPGSINGPADRGCSIWSYQRDRCPRIGFTVFAAVVSVGWGILWLINAILMLAFDLLRPKVLSPDDRHCMWWRAQVGAKVWLIFQQLQWFGLIGAVGLPLNTVLLGWTLPFSYWTLFNIPLPWSVDTADRTGPRWLFNIDQYASGAGAFTSQAFAGTFFWVFVLSLIVGAVVGIVLLIGWLAFASDSNVAEMCRARPHYVIHHWVMIVIPGLLLTGCYNLTRATTVGYGADALLYFFSTVTVLSLAIGYPLVVMLQLRGRVRQFFLVPFMMRFSHLYAQFKHTHWWYSIVSLARIIVVPMIIGFLQGSTAAGNVAVALLFFYFGGLAVAAIAVRPYFDKVHLCADVIINVLNMVICILLFTQQYSVGSSATYGVAITIIILCILNLIIGVLAYVDSWLRVLWRFVGGKKNKD